MGLQGAGLVLRYIYNYRMVHIAGRFGGGKTSLAFRLAYELLLKYDFRYIISNVDSVWADDLDAVVLRKDGKGKPRFADCIIILDEAGEFISTASQAKEWLSFLRKFNIVLLLPSAMPPYRDMKLVSIRRESNYEAWGLPMWRYKCMLQSGDIEEQVMFNWWWPYEIYGVYDTLGLPSDADEILARVKSWVAEVAGKTGYEKTANKIIGIPASARLLNGSTDSTSQALVDIGGEIDGLIEATAQAKRAFSPLGRETKGRRRS